MSKLGAYINLHFSVFSGNMSGPNTKSGASLNNEWRLDQRKRCVTQQADKLLRAKEDNKEGNLEINHLM